MNKKIVINDITYELIENYRNAFNKEEFESKYTDYFYDFDYVLGDYSYELLRLKGFYAKNSSKVKDYNDIDNFKMYLSRECSYGCRYFLIKKVK
ncbi:MAG: DUF1027 domain-containing protein [Bacilli bacterium]|nr:DUF1027 domain-containing protein [Bacilli bacterium]